MSTILITGADGLLGKAIQRVSDSYSGNDYVFCNRSTADLTKETEVVDMYQAVKPDLVIHAAAKVGGIQLNRSFPADMFYENILMNSFMIHHAQRFGVTKMLCVSTVCSFPDGVPILQEELQQTGQPFEDNFAYGYAKRMVDIQIKAYRKQYGVDYCLVIPTNIYGPHDNFNLKDGHVIPALIHKCYLAKRDNTPFEVWGDGRSLREFIYADDLAHLMLQFLSRPHLGFDKIIMSDNEEVSIRDMCHMICEEMGFDGELKFDESKPGGQFRRPSDISRLRSVIPDFKFIDKREGIKETIEWFQNNYPKVRS